MCVTTVTCASDLTLLTSAPASVCQRGSGIAGGFSTTSSAPAASTSLREYEPSRPTNALRNRIGVGWRAMMRCVASMPSMPGMTRSIVTRSGRSCPVSSTASRPVPAMPTTRMPASDSSTLFNTSRATGESSTISTRTPGAWTVIASRPPGRGAMKRCTNAEDLVLIELTLGHVRVGAGIETGLAVVSGVARRDDDHRQSRRRGSARRCAVSSKPSMFGMSTSVITRSQSPRRSTSRASTPSCAISTS